LLCFYSYGHGVFKKGDAMNKNALMLFAFLQIACSSCLADENGAWREEQKILNCGEHRISISISCVDVEDVPFCPNESIRFTHKKTYKTRFIDFNFAFMDGNPPYLASATCVSRKARKYLVLQNANSGNCMGCEWADVYSEAGAYLGSTSGIYKNRFYKYKPLDRSALPIVFESESKGKYEIVESVEINRF
jgi:hypothetical protein